MTTKSGTWKYEYQTNLLRVSLKVAHLFFLKREKRTNFLAAHIGPNEAHYTKSSVSWLISVLIPSTQFPGPFTLASCLVGAVCKWCSQPRGRAPFLRRVAWKVQIADTGTVYACKLDSLFVPSLDALSQFPFSSPHILLDVFGQHSCVVLIEMYAMACPPFSRERVQHAGTQRSWWRE